MAPSVKEVLRFIGRSSKRIAVTVVGAALVAGGLAMLVLPGPGILVVALGFAILGTEYAWAAAALERTKRTAERAGRVAKGAVRSASGRMRRRPPTAGPPTGDPPTVA
jgi:Flp pilus assembly protein TadB